MSVSDSGEVQCSQKSGSRLAIHYRAFKIAVAYRRKSSKRWGIKNLKPILCVHGWQDNASTFDKLIPLLPSDYCYVAVDLPGHGFSSHIPPGLFYTPIEYIAIIRRVQFYFNWSSFGYIGHSFGGACGMIFASCFPQDVNFLIAIENIKPLSAIAAEYVTKMPDVIYKMLACDNKTINTAPLYSKEELIERWIKGSLNSLTKESVEVLMERGTQMENGKYKLTRDCRVKIGNFSNLMQKDILDMARKVTCSLLYIRATKGLRFESEDYIAEVVNTLKSNVKYFEEQTIAGTHHLHLNNPELVGPIISKFIRTVGAK